MYSEGLYLETKRCASTFGAEIVGFRPMAPTMVDDLGHPNCQLGLTAGAGVGHLNYHESKIKGRKGEMYHKAK